MLALMEGSTRGDTLPRLWLKRRLLEIGKSQRELAAHLSVHPSQIGRLIHKDRPIGAREIRPIASFLEWTDAELLERIHGAPPPPAEIEVAGYIGELGEVYPAGARGHGLAHEALRIRSVPARSDFRGEVFIVATRAIPRYELGDALYCERLPRLEAAIGRECVVTLAGDGRALRRVQAGTRPGRFVLVARTGETMIDAAITAAYGLVWILSGDRQ